MKVAYKTDTGKQRKQNEDSILVDESLNIFLVADGLGGHQAGEVASNLAVKECYKYLKQHLDKTKTHEDISRLLTTSLMKAHDAIREKSMTDINLMGMGTTLIQMIIQGRKAYLCHVGDSRAYLLREGIKQLTKNHTFESYILEEEIMRREYFPIHKLHILTQAVGESEKIVPELKQVELETEDALLLCTDGLTDMLSDREIELIIRQHEDDLNTAVDDLIKEANNKGGIDNISVIIVKYE
ncbi:MAG: serine/threonine-protein phosphatase [wastewater metagenome]|nr:serine/threonine-protein phosphatase [Candidatus Loosdrechtia aerotolerans]